MNIIQFLLDRIAEDEDAARLAESRSDGHLWVVTGMDNAVGVDYDPARVLAECAAKRQIVELHRDWPVLVERPMEFAPSFGAEQSYTDQITMRASKQIAWMTEQEYRNRFGDEPPTGTIIRALAAVYADHPDHPDNQAADDEANITD